LVDPTFTICRSYSLPSTHRRLKKIKHPLHDWFRHGSHTPPSLPCLSSTFLSIVVVPAPPWRACRARPHHPLATVASTAGVCPIAGAAQPSAPLPSSSTVTAQPGFHYAVLRPPNCHVMLKAHVVAYVSDVYCKCFRWMLQK
jgi:hypothetical protein